MRWTKFARRSRLLAMPPRFFFLLLLLAATAVAEPLRIRGSTTATAPLFSVASKLRDVGVRMQIDSDSNTSAAIASLGEGGADVAIATRPVTTEERSLYAKVRLIETPVGMQILALVVSDDVWSSGIRSLSKEQVRGIYEREVTNWKELGGLDHPIQFFSPEPGHGVWELLVTWLYGDTRKAPLAKGFEVVNGGEETRNTVEFHPGGLSVMSPVWIDDRGTFGIALKSDKGPTLQPTVKAARDQGYPMARALTLVTVDRPAGDIKKLIDFMLGPQGQEALRKAEFLPLGDASAPE